MNREPAVQSALECAQHTLRQACHQLHAALAEQPEIREALATEHVSIDAGVVQGFPLLRWSNCIEGDGEQALPGGYVALLTVQVGTYEQAPSLTMIAVAGATPDDVQYTAWDGDAATTMADCIVTSLFAPTNLVDTSRVHFQRLIDVISAFVLDALPVD